MIPLYYPNSYLIATKKQLDKVCNGCGAEGGIKVPNKMYMLCIVEACEVHDWMFHIGKTAADLDFANAMFDYNLRAIIKNNSSQPLRYLRLARSDKYSYMVEQFGEKAYWVNKEKNDGINITIKGQFKKSKS